MIEYTVSSVCHELFPTEIIICDFYCDEEVLIRVLPRIPNNSSWGEIQVNNLQLSEKLPMPNKLLAIWLSVVEKKFYELKSSIPKSAMELLWEYEASNNVIFSQIVVGLAPYGYACIWFSGFKKAVYVGNMKGDYCSLQSEYKAAILEGLTIERYCDFYINNDSRVKENLKKNGLPPRDLFDNYMKQFTYRYQVIFGHWDEEKKEWKKEEKGSQQTISSGGKSSQTEEEEKSVPEFEYIEEALFDGTHDKLHDGGLMKYHEAGKPKKLAVKWHVEKKEWTAYLWFEDEEIRRVFDRFYGAHPETKTDFIIRIDPEKDHYELSIYRQGLREPIVIQEKVYQLLVFRNKFECFRSDNYKQERGAWIW